MKTLITVLTFILLGVSINTYADDFISLRERANNGNVAAQLQLGNIYFTGQGVKINYQEAVKWFSLSAEKGSSVGQSKLANIYNKIGNTNEAFKWYEIAANKGNKIAQYNLGLMYYYGQGTKREYSKARQFFKMACNNGLKAGCSSYKALR